MTTHPSTPHQSARQQASTLNRQQRAAVHFVDGPLLVLAGAGSGKTSVITRKIAWLVEGCGIPARHIAAVTFTNKAAREMKQRVGQLLQGRDGRGLTVCTFHRLGLDIIQRELANVGRKRGFSIFDEQDAKALLKDLLLDHSDAAAALLDIHQQQISQWKNEGLEPDAVAGLASNAREQRMVEVYRRYQRALASYNAVDFDDLINLPLQLFERDAATLQRWQRKIRYLLVDEYQDTNASQYRLVQLLVGDRNGLTVVGDDDQSIYAWRGAKPENLAQLESDFPALKVIKLEQNYRSTNRILRAANQLIANNVHVYEKKLWSEKGIGDSIQLIQVGNETAEAERIADLILDKKLGTRKRFKDFAILTRSNHQARPLEIALQVKQIPYHVNGGTSFFSRTEVKDIMAYLRLLANPDDDAAFLRIVNVPRRKIGPTSLEALGQYANERHCSLNTAASEFGFSQAMSDPARHQAFQRIDRFVSWLENLRRQIDDARAMPAIREMLADIDYEGWLHQNSSSAAVAERRMENIHFLLGSVEKALKSPTNDDDAIQSDDEPDEKTLESVIKKMMLRDLLEQQSEEAADDKVQILTLHASKGLEFPNVFILGFEENLLPHRNSIDNGDVEEERRLAYVGLTRAQQSLTLTMARQRKQFGDMLNCQPSRFIDELPQDDLQRIGFGGEQDVAANQQQGDKTIASLKNMFD